MESIRDVGPNLKSFYYHKCKPSDDSLIRGYVILLHGAEEYGGRYETFGDELTTHGYVMCAIDHIGHGMTAMGDKKALGKWKKSGKTNDFYLSAYNAFYLADKIKREHPNKPVYLLGYDFGGTMAQYMLSKFPNTFDGVILAGCGKSTARENWIFLKSWVKKVLFFDETTAKGTFRSRTRLLNMHFMPAKTKYDWMNSDPDEVKRFIDDKLSGFVADIGYYYYLYKYIVFIPEFMRKRHIDRKIPMLFVGGKDDYMTGRGRKINLLANYYKRRHFENVTVKLYDGVRHDVLMDRSKKDVAQLIAEFIDRNSYKEEVVEKEKTNEIQTVRVITVGNINAVKDNPSFELKEEEPEDDLRLSNKLKD